MRGPARGQGGAGRRGSQQANPYLPIPIPILLTNRNLEKIELDQSGAGSYRSSSPRGSLTSLLEACSFRFLFLFNAQCFFLPIKCWCIGPGRKTICRKYTTGPTSPGIPHNNRIRINSTHQRMFKNMTFFHNSL